MSNSRRQQMTYRPPRRELVITGLVAASMMLGLAIVFYGAGIASGSELFFTHDLGISDIWHLNYPAKHFYQQELQAGRLPHWCPQLGTGFPLHASGQVAALYPLNLLLYASLSLALAFNWSLLLHVILSGGFAAMLARQLGAGRSGALLAALVFGFSGFFVTHVKHVNMTAAAVWIPLILLLLERYVQARRLKTLAALALVVAAMILAGHPQIAYYNLLVAAGYSVFLLIGTWRSEPSSAGARNALRCGGALAYAVFLGVLLGAPQLLPTKGLHELGPREGGVTVDYATVWDYQPKHLLAFIRPKAFGDPGELVERPALDPRSGRQLVSGNGKPVVTLTGFQQDPDRPILFWEMTGYVGLLPLVLVVACLCLGFRRHRVRMLLVSLVLMLLLTLGKQGGLFYPLFYGLPGFKYFRFHDRFLLYVDLVLALMAAIGFSLILARSTAGKRRLTAAAVTVLAIAICFLDLRAALGDHNPRIEATRWTTPPASAVRVRQEEEGQGPYRIAAHRYGEVFVNAYNLARGWKGDLSPYDPAKTMLDANLSLLYGVTNLHIYGPLYPRWMIVPSRLFASRNPVVLNKVADLFNVRYILNPSGPTFDLNPRTNEVDPLAAAIGENTLIEKYAGDIFLMTGPLSSGERGFVEGPPFEIRLYRNPDALPRAFLVPEARVVIDGPSALVDPAFDPRRVVLIHEEPGGEAIRNEAPGNPIGARVEFLRYAPHEVRLKVRAPRECWLFLSDTYYPGWSATVNGKTATIQRANITGRAIRLEKGDAEVVFTFTPSAFRWGALVALVGVALLLTLKWQARLMRLIPRRRRAGGCSSGPPI